MSVSSAARSQWPRYGAVPLTRCPDCKRPEALKRWVSKTDENGNRGREYVSCLSKRHTGSDGQILKKCSYFEWMDDYLERIVFEGYIDSMGAANLQLRLGGLPPVGVEMGESSEMGAPGAGREVKRNARNGELPGLPSESELNQELKKIKKHLKQMVDLQKQANMMAGGFYCCIVALFFVYLLIRR